MEAIASALVPSMRWPFLPQLPPLSGFSSYMIIIIVTQWFTRRAVEPLRIRQGLYRTIQRPALPQRPATASRLHCVPVLFSYEHMPDDNPMPDPQTPGWPIAWAAKEVLRRHLGPKFDRRLPTLLATAIIERMKLTRWLIIKGPPDPPHSTLGE